MNIKYERIKYDRRWTENSFIELQKSGINYCR